MENYDRRRRHADDEQSRRYSSQGEDRDRDRSWRPQERDRDSRQAGEQTGWLDYDRNPGRSDQRYAERVSRDEQRYGEREGSERFSPDWSREGSEPRRSDEQYYARNRERGGSSDYYSPDWPYERSGQGRDEGRELRRDQRADAQRLGIDDQESHYRGHYRRSAQPFSYPGGSGMLYSESLTLHGPYSGRGPKGYKRSDQQIMEDACQRLERDGEIDASDIEVSAEDGVIVLRGTVQDRQTKRRAEECVESVYGARDVMNELRVAAQGSEQSQSQQRSAGTQASQRAQRPQTSRGSQSAQGSQSSAGASRGGSGSSVSEQSGEDQSSPKH